MPLDQPSHDLPLASITTPSSMPSERFYICNNDSTLSREAISIEVGSTYVLPQQLPAIRFYTTY